MYRSHLSDSSVFSKFWLYHHDIQRPSYTLAALKTPDLGKKRLVSHNTGIFNAFLKKDWSLIGHLSSWTNSISALKIIFRTSSGPNTYFDFANLILLSLHPILYTLGWVGWFKSVSELHTIYMVIFCTWINKHSWYNELLFEYQSDATHFNIICNKVLA